MNNIVLTTRDICSTLYDLIDKVRMIEEKLAIKVIDALLRHIGIPEDKQVVVVVKERCIIKVIDVKNLLLLLATENEDIVRAFVQELKDKNYVVIDLVGVC